MPQIEDEELQVAELAYNAFNNALFIDITIMPFDDLSDRLKEAWRAAVITVVEYTKDRF